ncbi:MAG: glycosyltransferase family 4 protein [Patescibacteria group bacterium]|nr:glycosyltransferase family 4 protein [Patescibacteria group bacterium]
MNKTEHHNKKFLGGILIHEHNYGGSYIASKKIANATNSILVPLSDNKNTKNKNIFSIKIKKIFGKRFLANINNISNIEKNVFLWHINYPSPIILPLIIFSKKPKIITFHFMPSKHPFKLEEKNIFNFLINKLILNPSYKVILNLMILLVDKLTFITNSQFLEYKNYILFKKIFHKKSIVINNFIEKEIISTFKKKHLKKICILFVGRMNKLKGFDDLIELCKNIKDKDISFNFIGGGPLKEKSEDLFNIKSYSNIVNKKLLQYYDKSQIFILPSYTEVFPMTILEAMARGLVILVSDIPGMREIVKEGRNGYLFKPGDTEKMKELILYLKNNPKEIERISKNNLKDIHKFTAEKQIPKYIKVYNKVLKEK